MNLAAPWGMEGREGGGLRIGGDPGEGGVVAGEVVGRSGGLNHGDDGACREEFEVGSLAFAVFTAEDDDLGRAGGDDPMGHAGVLDATDDLPLGAVGGETEEIALEGIGMDAAGLLDGGAGESLEAAFGQGGAFGPLLPVEVIDIDGEGGPVVAVHAADEMELPTLDGEGEGAALEGLGDAGPGRVGIAEVEGEEVIGPGGSVGAPGEAPSAAHIEMIADDHGVVTGAGFGKGGERFPLEGAGVESGDFGGTDEVLFFARLISGGHAAGAVEMMMMGDKRETLGGIAGGQRFPLGAIGEEEAMERTGDLSGIVVMPFAVVPAEDVDGALMGDGGEAGDRFGHGGQHRCDRCFGNGSRGRRVRMGGATGAEQDGDQGKDGEQSAQLGRNTHTDRM